MLTRVGKGAPTALVKEANTAVLCVMFAVTHSHSWVRQSTGVVATFKTKELLYSGMVRDAKVILKKKYLK